ncbi:elongation factor 1-beta [Candidatus Pacearchaeota archaeon]|nr:elongation factor 1-beta [Candidatus Pacearchaeota archaeon]
MGIALLTIKLMPSSPEEDLEKIKEKAKEIIEAGQGKKVRFEEEPVAFGLKAVIAYFDLDESQELDPIEKKLGEIESVSSSQVTDMRRAFG